MGAAAHQTQPLEHFFRDLDCRSSTRWWGRVIKAVDQVVESEGPHCAVGECCEIVDSDGNFLAGEVVGFRGSAVLSMPLEKTGGVRYGDRISTCGEFPQLRVGDELIGRVLDARGRTIDSGPALQAVERCPLHTRPRPALDRELISRPLGTGVRAIDGFITCGQGQRLGIFGGSGVGKSTLIGMMARESAAQVTVLGLVGERGREVGEFLHALGPKGRQRSVVVVSTSDESPLLRIRAALAATAVAEYFAACGRHVLLVVDSLTRVAMAQRELGLAAGEPPTSRGYTPSCFTLLAQLIERAGNFRRGSITAFYTVLMEGDDQQDTLVDAVRALLDGHIMLDRKLNVQGHFPPISVLDSLSRLASAVCSKEHQEKARRLRKLLAVYAAAEDLIRVGAYQKGLDPILDQAVASLPEINAFLEQRTDEGAPFEEHVSALESLPG